MKNNRALYGWLLIGPFFLSLVVFFVYALVRAIYFSFTDYNLFESANWVGLDNFINIVGDKLFLLALMNTVVFSVVVTLLQTVLALALALVVSRDFFGKHVFRVVFYVPSILSSASITLIFIWFFQKNGFLNSLLSELASTKAQIFALIVIFCASMLAMKMIRAVFKGGVRSSLAVDTLLSLAVVVFVAFVIRGLGIHDAEQVEVQISWLGTQEYWGPLPRTMWAIVIQNIYTTVPTFMLLFLAGLQGIPKELYEAAKLDGAGRLQQLLHITIPQLTPVTFVVVTFGIIGTLQMFDQAALLGSAAPLESKVTLAYYVYHNAFPPGGEPAIGMASAAALVLAMLTLLIVYLQKVLGVREKVDA